MNFLAHIYLSFEKEEIAIGNFIADGIRGKDYLKYSKEIQQGILLHRAIDTFTDAHPTVRQSTKRLHKNQGHYSGVVVDIFYDHFLAKNWNEYSNTSLHQFVSNFYQSLEGNYEILPSKIQQFMPYMIKQNWLYNYRSLVGINRVLNGMFTRTKKQSNMNFAILDLEKYYSEFESEFSSFFKELIIFSQRKLKSIKDED